LDHIGPYNIIEELGQGGMGVVYRARQSSLNRQIALKVLPTHLEGDETAVRRFRQEGETAARLKHENIVTVFDAHVDEPPYYIAMEFLEGRSLADIIASRGPLEIGDASAILSQMCAALEHAHEKGIIHRDIKPGNIMVSDNGKATLTDFGIARASDQTRLTNTGAVFGSPDYMSPEQAKGLPVDHRTDIYSLGAVLYEALAGRAPFAGHDPLTVMYRIVNEDPPSPRSFNAAIPTALEAVAKRAMDKDPRNRFQTCAEMATALENAKRQPDVIPQTVASPIVQEPIPQPVLTGGVAPRTGQHRTALLGSLLGVVILLMALTIYLAIGAKKQPPPPPPPEGGTSTKSSTGTFSSDAKKPSVLSTGVKVPPVWKMPKAEAIAALQKQSLIGIPATRKVSSNAVAPGCVVSCKPPSGKIVASGSTIRLTISSGKPTPKIVYHKPPPPLTFPCTYPGCGATFRTKDALERHIQAVHSKQNNIRRFKCKWPGCDQSFDSKTERDLHFASHFLKKRR